MVDQIDLPEDDDLGQVQEACKQACVKSRRRRASQQGFPKRDVVGRFRRSSFRRRLSTGVSNGFDSHDPRDTPTSTSSRPPSASRAPAPGGYFPASDRPNPTRAKPSKPSAHPFLTRASASPDENAPAPRRSSNASPRTSPTRATTSPRPQCLLVN